MKDDDYFDQDLVPDTPPLPALRTDDALTEEETLMGLPDAEPHDTGRTEAAASAPPVAAAPKKPAWEWMGYGVKAWAGFGVLFLVLTGWLVWPDAPARRAAEPLEDTAPAQNAPGTEQTPPALSVQAQAGSTDRLQQELTTLMSAQQHYSQQNREDIAQLARRMDDEDRLLNALETRLSALEAAQLAALKKAQTAPAPRAPEPVPSLTHHRRRAVPRASTAGWSVNTVYPGMAWLRHGDSTWAVQPGDTLQGLHITGIDVTRREVLTDHGVIH